MCDNKQLITEQELRVLEVEAEAEDLLEQVGFYTEADKLLSGFQAMLEEGKNITYENVCEMYDKVTKEEM